MKLAIFRTLAVAGAALLGFSLSVVPNVWPQLATRQLEQMTGQKIRSFTYKGMPRATGTARTPGMARAPQVARMPASVGGLMFMASMMELALDLAMQAQALKAQRHGPGPGWRPGAAGAPQVVYSEQLRQELQQQLNELVPQQAARREADSQAGLEQLSQALIDVWDGGKAPSEMASALRDPVGPGSRGDAPGETDADVVDLRDRTRDVPQIPRGDKPPPPTPAPKASAPAKGAAKPLPQTGTMKKLSKMVQENQDPARLDRNLEKLEDRLAKVRELADKIREGAQFTPQDLRDYDRALMQAAQEGMLRGLSLATDFRGDLAAGEQGLLNWYKEKKANSAQMNQLLDASNNINEFAEFADHYHEFKPGELKDLMWKEANRDIMKNLDFFRTQHTINPGQYQTGKAMINESVALAEGREELGQIEVRVKIKGLSPFFWDRKKQLDQQAARLAETARGARRDLALKKDLPPTPGKPELASAKPAPATSRTPSLPAASSLPVMDNLKVIPLDLKQPAAKYDLAKLPAGEPPRPAPKYRQVLFQGVVGAKQEDQGLLQAIQNNPLFQDPEKRYVFAFPGGPQSDRLMHNPESNPDHFFKKCAELKDMEVESLLFTGNMVPMVEMFLRARFLKVRNLVLITDTSKSYPKLEDLMTLAKNRGIRFNWYLHQDGKLENFYSPHSGIRMKEFE